MRKGFRFLTILAIGAMLLFPACTAMDGDAPVTPAIAPATTIPQLASQVQALNSQIAALSNQVANLPAAGATDTTALQQQISTLSTVISELSSRVVSLENELASGGSTSSTGTIGEIDETTDWGIDAWVDYDADYDIVEVQRIKYPTIEDEDDYIIYLYLQNLNIEEYSTKVLAPSEDIEGDLWWDDGVMKKCVDEGGDTWGWEEVTDMRDIYSPVDLDGITLKFSPNSGDRVIVSEDTFLDNVSWPDLDWDTEVSARSDGTCRNIKCETSSEFKLPVPDGFDSRPECPTPTRIKLVFELYYG